MLRANVKVKLAQRILSPNTLQINQIHLSQLAYFKFRIPVVYVLFF
jgi:hypothetical protein